MKSKEIKVSLVLLEILIMLVYLNPVADFLPSSVQIIVFFAWLLSIVNQKRTLGEGFRLCIFSIIILLITFLRCVCANQLNMGYYSSLQVVIQRYQFVIYPILFVYVSKLDFESKRKIFKWALLCITGTVVVSLYYVLRVDPQAIRNTQGVSYFGVGDFQLMYAMAILFGPLFFVLLNKIKKKKKFMILAIALSLMALCLLLCNLVTSVVLALCSVFISYILTRKNKPVYTLVGAFCILLVAFKSVIGQLLLKLASKQLFYWSTNNKIIAIANVLLGDMTHIDTLSRRGMLAGQSLKSFREHPLLGINFKDHVSGKIGCHCQFADDLGRFGILGNIFIWFNYYRIVKYTIQYNKNIIVKNNMISAWICFFILGFLNPCLSATILMAILVVIPTFDAI